jgi:hypothetical protein
MHRTDRDCAPELPGVVITIATVTAVAEVGAMSMLIPLVIAVAPIPLARIVVVIAWVVATAGVVKHESPPQRRKPSLLSTPREGRW